MFIFQNFLKIRSAIVPKFSKKFKDLNFFFYSISSKIPQFFQKILKNILVYWSINQNVSRIKYSIIKKNL